MSSEAAAPVVFMGTPETAVPSLQALIDHPECRVVGVFTQPDRPVGRGRRMQASPVKQAAEAAGIPVQTPHKPGDEEGMAALTAWSPRLIVVCAYGRILPGRVLELPPLGCYNLHFSLLPRWRGASPVQAAIRAGDTYTGVSLQRMVRELDAGAIVANTPPMPIQPRDTALTLSDRLAQAAGDLLSRAVPALLSGEPTLHEQDATATTYCHVLSKNDGAVDFAAETAEAIERTVRAFTPWPGCFAYLGERRLGLVRTEVVLEEAAPPEAGRAAPGTVLQGGLVPAREGFLRLLQVKPEGKGAMDFEAFARGAPYAVGGRLTPKPAA